MTRTSAERGGLGGPTWRSRFGGRSVHGWDRWSAASRSGRSGALSASTCADRGGGWRLRQRYIDAFASAQQSIQVAHGYFLPDPGVVRAITAAARRGVRVRLLLAGMTDIPFARAATRSLHRHLLAAGVCIHEWTGSVLHAKVAAVDGRRLLIGSFNLDPLSLANLEALVEVDDPAVVARGETWIEDHLARSRAVTSVDASSWLKRWLLDPMGRVVARMADTAGRVIARPSERLASADYSRSSDG